MQLWRSRPPLRLAFLLVWSLLASHAIASYGDRLPEFVECIAECERANCQDGVDPTPLHLRLLLWTCSSNCDYACQRILTIQRQSDPLNTSPVVQYHGKWPFHRLLGIQEPFSVLFSLFNFLAHQHGLAKIKAEVPNSFPLKRYYVSLAYVGMAAWVFSMVFHVRDFGLTETLDYFAAGAYVLYGLYMAPIRMFRLDRAQYSTTLRLWTLLCAALYLAHISYLTFVRWDYGYNMGANVVVGAVQNALWTWFSVKRYGKLRKSWAAWPGLIVGWIMCAMGLELLDFPPVWGMLDAHSLWHLGTVGPTVWWYRFLLKDSQEQIEGQRYKS